MGGNVWHSGGTSAPQRAAGVAPGSAEQRDGAAVGAGAPLRGPGCLGSVTPTTQIPCRPTRHTTDSHGKNSPRGSANHQMALAKKPSPSQRRCVPEGARRRPQRSEQGPGSGAPGSWRAGWGHLPGGHLSNAFATRTPSPPPPHGTTGEGGGGHLPAGDSHQNRTDGRR